MKNRKISPELIAAVRKQFDTNQEFIKSLAELVLKVMLHLPNDDGFEDECENLLKAAKAMLDQYGSFLSMLESRVKRDNN